MRYRATFTVETTLFTPLDLWTSLVFTSFFLITLFAHRAAPPLIVVLVTCFCGWIASAPLSKVILGALSGRGRVTIGVDALDDSKLEVGIIRWIDIEKAEVCASLHGSCRWVELHLAAGRRNPHALRNSLRVRGSPSRRTDRAYIDLKIVDKSDIVRGAVLELANGRKFRFNLVGRRLAPR